MCRAGFCMVVQRNRLCNYFHCSNPSLPFVRGVVSMLSEYQAVFGYLQELLWYARIGPIRANNAVQLD